MFLPKRRLLVFLGSAMAAFSTASMATALVPSSSSPPPVLPGQSPPALPAVSAPKPVPKPAPDPAPSKPAPKPAPKLVSKVAPAPTPTRAVSPPAPVVREPSSVPKRRKAFFGGTICWTAGQQVPYLHYTSDLAPASRIALPPSRLRGKKVRGYLVATGSGALVSKPKDAMIRITSPFGKGRFISTLYLHGKCVASRRAPAKTMPRTKIKPNLAHKPGSKLKPRRHVAKPKPARPRVTDKCGVRRDKQLAGKANQAYQEATFLGKVLRARHPSLAYLGRIKDDAKKLNGTQYCKALAFVRKVSDGRLIGRIIKIDSANVQNVLKPAQFWKSDNGSSRPFQALANRVGRLANGSGLLQHKLLHGSEKRVQFDGQRYKAGQLTTLARQVSLLHSQRARLDASIQPAMSFLASCSEAKKFGGTTKLVAALPFNKSLCDAEPGKWFSRQADGWRSHMPVQPRAFPGVLRLVPGAAWDASRSASRINVRRTFAEFAKQNGISRSCSQLSGTERRQCENLPAAFKVLKAGFVASDKVWKTCPQSRSMAQYRRCFAKANGRWKAGAIQKYKQLVQKAASRSSSGKTPDVGIGISLSRLPKENSMQLILGLALVAFLVFYFARRRRNNNR